MTEMMRSLGVVAARERNMGLMISRKALKILCECPARKRSLTNVYLLLFSFDSELCWGKATMVFPQ